MNPINAEFLILSELNTEYDVEQIVCEYEKGRGTVKISFYPPQEGSTISSSKKDIKELSLEKFCHVINLFTKQELSSGTERNGLYDTKSHREIVYFRLFLPSGKVQLDYIDDSMNIDYSPFIEEYIRNNFKVIH